MDKKIAEYLGKMNSAQRAEIKGYASGLLDKKKGADGMNEKSKMEVFQNQEFGSVRTAEEDGKVLFCGSDVAKALGYSRPNEAVSKHCRGTAKRRTPTSSGIQEMLFIPEGDVYRLIAHSKLPSAQRFESWVFDEVLPSIKRHGAYMTLETLQAAILNPDTMIQLCQQLKAEQDRNAQLKAENSALVVQNQIAAPKAEYFDALVDRNLLTNFRQTAKELGVKEREFVSFLLSHKYIYRDKAGHLLPYSARNDGLFEIKECFNDKTNWKGTQTLITPKGRETFRLLCVAADKK